MSRVYDTGETERATAALLEYAKSIQQLHRAAEEGYDVVTAALDHWTSRFMSQCPGPFGVYATPFSQLIATERTAPLAEAFSVRDSIGDLVTVTATPHGQPLELLRIQRVRRKHVQFTAVVAIVDGGGVARGYPRALVWPTEDIEALEHLAAEAH